jgi:hypothetical protein
MNIQTIETLESIISFALNDNLIKKEFKFEDETVFELLKSISAKLRENNIAAKSVKHESDSAYSFIVHSPSKFSLIAMQKGTSVIVKTERLFNSNNQKVTALEKYKKGRPEVIDINKRNKLIKMYVTEEEKQWFIKHQEKAGYKQLSRFVYEKISDCVKTGKFSYEVPTEVNKDLQRSIIGIANNINQAIAFTHSTGNIKHLEAFRAELKDALQKLNEVQNEIRGYKKSTQISHPDQLAIIEHLLFNKAA